MKPDAAVGNVEDDGTAVGLDMDVREVSEFQGRGCWRRSGIIIVVRSLSVSIPTFHHMRFSQTNGTANLHLLSTLAPRWAVNADSGTLRYGFAALIYGSEE